MTGCLEKSEENKDILNEIIKQIESYINRADWSDDSAFNSAIILIRFIAKRSFVLDDRIHDKGFNMYLYTLGESIMSFLEMIHDYLAYMYEDSFQKEKGLHELLKIDMDSLLSDRKIRRKFQELIK